MDLDLAMKVLSAMALLLAGRGLTRKPKGLEMAKSPGFEGV